LQNAGKIKKRAQIKKKSQRVSYSTIAYLRVSVFSTSDCFIFISHLFHIRCIRVTLFVRPYLISVAFIALMLKGATEKCDLKTHLCRKLFGSYEQNFPAESGRWRASFDNVKVTNVKAVNK